MLRRLGRAARLLSRKLWVRASLYAVVGVAAALLGIGAERYVPWARPIGISPEAVNRILDILASSMLAVTTFSLGIMISSYGSATANVSPRAAKLLMQDPTSQKTLATFIGSFLFSLVAIIALSTGLYGDRGRTVLFVATLAMVALIVLTMLRWIEHLSRLGRVESITERVEEATRDAIEVWAASPYLGARAATGGVPSGMRPLFSATMGYVQHIDVHQLDDIAADGAAEVRVAAPVGAFVDLQRPLLWLAGDGAKDLAEDRADDLREAFSIEPERSFDHDIRFGLVVLAEIASRALSPAVNDQGTAIDVIGRGVRVLTQFSQASAQIAQGQSAEPEHRHVAMLALDADDLFDDLFGPIARDGAAVVEVQIRLQKALASLGASGVAGIRQAAERHARLALKRAEGALALEDDKETLRRLVAGAWPAGRAPAAAMTV